MKVKEFINLKQHSMGVDEYSLKFSMLSRYAPSFVSNPRDDMCRFVTRVADLVREEYRTTILHYDMTLAILMVYAQSIKESKHCSIAGNMQRIGSSDQSQPRFKKKVSTQEKPRNAKVKFLKRGWFSKRQAYICYLWKEELWGMTI